MKIVLITSGQPSLNPRLVKEADALADNGYQVLVIYAYWNNWGTRLDEKLLPAKGWKAIRAGGDPQKKPLIYLVSRLIFKITDIAVKKFGIQYFAEFAVSRSSYFLETEAKKHVADLYIAHNLGALPAAVKAAKKFNRPCGFDAEDLHRYETSNDVNSADGSLKAYIEKKYIPQTNYFTASSEQIAAAYREIFPTITPVTILNVFPKSKLTQIQQTDHKLSLKLFWFSQTIGHGRGLEQIIETLQTLKQYPFELHLLGDFSDSAFKDYLAIAADGLQVFIYPPVASESIADFAAQFDIGLAVETAAVLNRDICLTNKLFTYQQAGLAIIASDTTAQNAFMHLHPAIGLVYKKNDTHSLAQALIWFNENRNELQKARQAALTLAHTTLNWETESVKFLQVVDQTIKAF